MPCKWCYISARRTQCLSHLDILRLALGAAGATAGVFLVPLVTTAGLGVVGFSAAGPVAGTMAAGIQAGIGNVAAGSLFATAQSVAMGGAIPSIITAIGAGLGGVVVLLQQRSLPSVQPLPLVLE
ncbi:hypothetical protein EDB87DRAFT_3643 [Lactarius vividus]|nr:hypothetical protein EDB87DRAFT_3643 [Lactarius vividus]